MGYIREVDISAPRARVWNAWTSEQEIARWLAPRSRIEPRPGGAFSLTWDTGNGAGNTEGCRILHIDPRSHIAFEWRGTGAFEDLFRPPFGPTRIDVRFEDLSDSTRVIVEQPETRALDGWTAYDEWMADAWEEALQGLKRYCERGEVVDVTSTFLTY